MTALGRRARVVLVCEASGGGVGKHVLDLAERLPARGFDVLLIHSARRAEADFAERIAGHGRHGYRVARVDVERRPAPGDVRGTLEVRRAIRDFGGADVLHGHSAKGGALARLARWGCARRVFYTPHAFYAQSPTLSAIARRLYGALEYGLSLATERVIATSREERALARALGIPERKLTVIENGIELRSDSARVHARALVRRALGFGEHDVVVGFVGRLVPQKAPELAVDVFRRLRDAAPATRLVIAGDGPQSPSVSDALERAGLARHVRWLRHVRGHDLLPAVDLLLVTSRYEGFSYVMLEALDSGCVIVTTPVGGAADCVPTGRNGTIAAGWSAEALAEAVLPFVREPLRLHAARAASREHARHFGIDRMIDRLATLYRSDSRDAA